MIFTFVRVSLEAISFPLEGDRWPVNPLYFCTFNIIGDRITNKFQAMQRFLRNRWSQTENLLWKSQTAPFPFGITNILAC